MEKTKKEKKTCVAHILAISYPSQGHVNPMLQFCKRLVSKKIKTTIVITNFIYNSMKPNLDSTYVGIDTISDGFDEGGFSQAAGNIHFYLNRLEIEGRKTLRELIVKHQRSEYPIDCLVYDAFLPWIVDVATEEFGLVTASFFTQPCAVNYVYHCIYHGVLKSPVTSFPVSIPGLPLLDRYDTPSFVAVEGSYPAYFELVLNQFLNAEKAEFMLVNTFYELEEEVVDTMSQSYPLLTIGPTLPSLYLDKRIENDSDYGLNLFVSDNSKSTAWLSSKPKGSVIYVSFGSMACLEENQMQELAWALKQSNYYFIWAVRSSEEEEKIPKEFLEEIIVSEKGILVRWSCQIEVLSSESVGCFFSHCGWNSTMEALSLGIPMVVMPQWTDQTMNAKLVQDVWKIGIRVKFDEGSGFVGREEIVGCIKEVMEGEKGKEMKRNALRWKDLAKKAVDEGGSSDKNIDAFVSRFRQT